MAAMFPVLKRNCLHHTSLQCGHLTCPTTGKWKERKLSGTTLESPFSYSPWLYLLTHSFNSVLSKCRSQIKAFAVSCWRNCTIWLLFETYDSKAQFTKSKRGFLPQLGICAFPKWRSNVTRCRFYAQDTSIAPHEIILELKFRFKLVFKVNPHWIGNTKSEASLKNTKQFGIIQCSMPIPFIQRHFPKQKILPLKSSIKK